MHAAPQEARSWAPRRLMVQRAGPRGAVGAAQRWQGAANARWGDGKPRPRGDVGGVRGPRTRSGELRVPARCCAPPGRWRPRRRPDRAGGAPPWPRERVEGGCGRWVRGEGAAAGPKRTEGPARPARGPRGRRARRSGPGAAAMERCIEGAGRVKRRGQGTQGRRVGRCGGRVLGLLSGYSDTNGRAP
jgi:hypothetical protein